MITLDTVDKWYNKGAANEVHALKRTSMNVGGNEVVCVQGPSGSGKSTLLSIIGCLFVPTSGRAIINGKQISRLPDYFLTLYRRQSIGFIYQHFHLLPGQSVVANITLPLLPLGVPLKEQQRRADILLQKLSLTHRREFDISDISGGEMQRTAIARALINDPPLIVADEPTAHLDEQLCREFMTIVAELKKEGKTIVLASHDPRVSRHHIIDRCLQMEDGKLSPSSC